MFFLVSDFWSVGVLIALCLYICPFAAWFPADSSSGLSVLPFRPVPTDFWSVWMVAVRESSDLPRRLSSAGQFGRWSAVSGPSWDAGLTEADAGLTELTRRWRPAEGGLRL